MAAIALVGLAVGVAVLASLARPFGVAVDPVRVGATVLLVATVALAAAGPGVAAAQEWLDRRRRTAGAGTPSGRRPDAGPDRRGDGAPS